MTGKSWFLSLLMCSFVSPAFTSEKTAVRQFDFEPNDEQRDRVVPVRIYLPKQKTPQPVVLFSHGLGGSRENSAYLGNHWAAGGYVCVFMQHAGSDEVIWQSAPLRERIAVLRNSVSAKTSMDRIHDVSFVIDQLQEWNQDAGHPLHRRLDPDHIGMSGHSFGAVTTLSVAGRKFPFGRSYADRRIDAFLAMSPQPGQGLSAERALGHIASPMLCMTGTRDNSPINNRVTPETRREVFRALPAGDKYELVFDGGHHFTFSDTTGFRTRDRDPGHHSAIQQISLKYWDAYLRNDRTSRQWLQSQQPNADGRLKDTDIWQWK